MLSLVRNLNSSCCSGRGKQITAYHHLLKSWVFFSTAVGKNPSLKTPPFIAEYLIESCGFSRDEAIKASLPIAHIKSTKKPALVVDFLKKNGLEQSHIRRVISLEPMLLCCNVQTTMEPKILALLDAGFSRPDLVRLISAFPRALSRNVGEMIEVLRTLLVTKERVLLAVELNPHLLGSGLNQRCIPNLSLLRKCVISEERLPVFLLRTIRLLNCKPSRIKEIFEVLRKFGFSPGLKMFEYAFYVFSSISTATVYTRCEVLKSYGFSDAEVLSAVRTYPNIMSLSEDNIRHKAAFFIEEVGCELSYIALHPWVLMYSLEKRMRPRYHVLQTLKSQGLHAGNAEMANILTLSEKKFLEKYCCQVHRDDPKATQSL